MDFILNPNLVLYLPLWKLDGSSFMSKDAYGHLCTVTGALWRPDGRYFDGTDDKIVSTANLGFSGTGERTLIAWACPDSASLVTKIAPIAALGWVNAAVGPVAGTAFIIATFGVTTGAGTWAMWGVSADVESSGVLTADTWYCLAATYSGTTVQLFQDGVVDNSETHSLDTLDAPFRVGQKLGSAADRIWFKGKVGEVFAYNRALTPIEIQNIYLATKWRYR